MDAKLLDLPWLDVPPDDLRCQLRMLPKQTSDSRTLAQRLCGYRLTGNRLHRAGVVIARLATQENEAIRLGVLSNGTADLLLPALTVSALRHGVWMQVIGTAFDQVAAAALIPTSEINRARCHFVLLCLDHRGLPLTPKPGDSSHACATVDAALEYIDSIRCALCDASGCTVIVQTVPQVSCSLFGSLDRNVPGTQQWLIDHYNRELRARIANSSDLLLDAAALAETIGTNQWHDATQWTLGKFQFSQTIVPLYADWVGRLIAAARGKARKCLVLDLDNTLWGGVVGDDGLSGIVLGKGSPTGEAYLSVQQTALALRERGIILAVSTKNDEDVARSAFRSHPEMLLKEEHIAVFQANWQDKASNLKAIAETLNIGVDALVLLDDNPAERGQVRAALPAVAVPNLPTDPAQYAETLLAAGYFETIVFTSEDRGRADQYQANAARAKLLGAATDLESYLQSLEMHAICMPFDAMNRARITQLINKSNQFNLTARRYTESEVESFEKSGSGLTLQVRLTDRFGDNGVISAVICVEQECNWIIDTWLMSCRVLNRRVEQTVLNYIASCARTVGIRALIGRYVKTERNSMVKDHYANLGFRPIRISEEGSEWRLDITSWAVTSVPIQIIKTAPSAEGTLII